MKASRKKRYQIDKIFKRNSNVCIFLNLVAPLDNLNQILAFLFEKKSMMLTFH